jgi:hypothetical protein
VYRNPKVGVVYLRAHEDTEGRLLGPQVMYEIVDPGGWNIDAAEQERGFIPASNSEKQPRGAPDSSVDSPLLDPDLAARITITGLMRLENRDEAEALARNARDGRIAVFDDQAGWLLVPGRAEGERPDERSP